MPLRRTVFIAKCPWLSQTILLIVLFLTSSVLLSAQEATIVGTVADQTGAVVPSVTITITNTQTRAARVTATNSVGQYVVAGLPIGGYEVTAEASTFKAEDVREVILNVNDRVRVDFRMSVGTKRETVSVSANSLAVQADSGEQSSLVSGTQISELSTNGRSIYTYVALAPGAADLMPSFQPPTPIGAVSNVSFNGNRQGHNLYMLDGGENYDRGGAGDSIIMPSIDAIAETQTLTSNYGAEYGLSSGGTISSALKSGTQSFHFSLWEFFRNDAFDARNYFNAAPSPVAELRYNLYGFNVGGPLTLGELYNPTKSKTFFFFNMEWRSLVQGQTLNQTVPRTAYYRGDFSTSGYGLAQLHAPAICQVSTAIQAQFAAAGQALSGCTNGAPDPSLYAPFNNNAIHLSLLDANAQALLTAGGKYGGIFPAPNNGDSFIGGNNQPTDVREEIVRIDHNVKGRFTVFGHLVADQISQTFGTLIFSPDNVPSVGLFFGNPAYAAVLHTVHVITPTLTNETSFNYNGNRVKLLPAGLVSAPPGFTFNRYFHGPNNQNRIPTIMLLGSTGSRYSLGITPWKNSANDYQVRDDLSWMRGRHEFKMGGSLMLYQKVQDWFQTTQGGFIFNGFYTGNDFADYLLGYAIGYNEAAVQSTGHWNSVSPAAYFQDNYRAHHRLTLNLGLRWDGIPHTYEAHKQMSNFDPKLYNPAAQAILNPDYHTISFNSPGLGSSPNPILSGQRFYVNGLGICGVSLPSGCVNGGWLNLAPRLGFAYDLTGSHSTVLRGGYGIMYERVQGNDAYNTAGNVPFSAGVNFGGVSLANPSRSILTGTTVPATNPVSSIVGLNQNDYAPPRSTQFSLGVQKAMGKTVLSVAYVGTQNRHQNYYTETNLPPHSLLPGFVANSSLAQTYNASVRYVGYSSVLMAQNGANGDYNSVQVSLRGTTSNNDLAFQVGYTYSHTNDSSGITGSQGDLYDVSDPYQGWKYDFGPATFDIRNNFFINFVYRIPLVKNSGKQPLKMTLGGWEVSGIVLARSGAPLNIGLAGPNVADIVPNTANRPNITGKMINPHTPAEWFDTSVFSVPAPGTWGNEPHDAVRGPGRDNWNLSLFKNLIVNNDRGTVIQFRAEFFNVWNHPQWVGDTLNGGIGTRLGANDFGAVTSAYDARTIQLALKLSF